MKKKSKTFAPHEKLSSNVRQHEDAALKTSMQFFAEELLPYFQIEGNVVAFAPTELVHLDLQKMFQDFNFCMEDGSWKHFEFQSTNEGLDGLKRFRAYEALTSYQYKVSVTTYVLFSGYIRNPMTEFTEGINTYRIHPIIMQDKDADSLLAELLQKAESGKPLSKKELVPLTLCSLMGGSLSQKERISTAYKVIRNAPAVETEDLQKMEAVLYAMADKFLDSIDLEELKEEISMTRLGQMLWEDGIAKGMEQGIEQGVKALVEVCRELGGSREDVRNRLVEKCNLTKERADEYIEKYWE